MRVPAAASASRIPGRRGEVGANRRRHAETALGSSRAGQWVCGRQRERQRLADAGNVSILQPDLSRCGGVTEAVRIAALASAAGLPVCTHGCHTGLNMAACVHFLASIDNARYFEGDGSTDNPLRTVACSASYELSPDGTVSPLEGPGIGVDV